MNSDITPERETMKEGKNLINKKCDVPGKESKKKWRKISYFVRDMYYGE